MLVSEFGTLTPGRVKTMALEGARRAAAFLVSNQASDGANFDWRSNNGFFGGACRIFQCWETTRAALALQLWAGDLGPKLEACLDKTVAYLKAEESPEGMMGSRRLRHGWFYKDADGLLVDPSEVVASPFGTHYSSKTRTKVERGRQYSRVIDENAYCTETSAEYVRMLLARNLNDRAIPAKLDYLRAQQSPDGSWNVINPDVRNERRWPSVTGFVVHVLSVGGWDPHDLGAARAYLLDSQRTDGSWGDNWQYYGTPYYTMVPILRALISTGSSADSEAITRARRFVLRSQGPDGSWLFVAPENPPAGAGTRRSTSAELQTGLALQAALLAGVATSDSSVAHGFSWLMSRQRDDGTWSGGLFPAPPPHAEKIEDAFATTCAMESLRMMYDAG